MKERYLELEKRISLFLRKYAVDLLRYSMGIVYFWFGLLKVLRISPVEGFVLRSTYWIDGPDFVFCLGFWEMLIGICLFIKPLMRLGLLLFFLHLPGTFLPIFLDPEHIFTVIPYGLTLEGEFVFKNLILLAVGLTLVSSLQREDSSS